MSFNKYNTRAGRFSEPDNSAPTRELSTGTPHAKTYDIAVPQATQQDMQFNNAFNQPITPPAYDSNETEPEGQDINLPHTPDADMKTEPMFDGDASEAAECSSQRLPWLKSRLQGVKKITNRERRRRQNENLRRLLSPKNALMVLNEIMPGENIFKVEAIPNVGQFFKTNPSNFCADLVFEGNSYKGYGDNKIAARNAAAEQAVRDLLLRRMTSALAAAEQDEEQRTETAEPDSIKDLPMIQLASFALHKLFSEWECQGHRVPTLRPASAVGMDCASDAGSLALPPPAARRQLPPDAAAMHPCMLLSHMRPGITYREAGAEGDRPQNMVFTMEVEVDGTAYSGRACNKREARRLAARLACQELYDVVFVDK